MKTDNLAKLALGVSAAALAVALFAAFSRCCGHRQPYGMPMNREEFRGEHRPHDESRRGESRQSGGPGHEENRKPMGKPRGEKPASEQKE